MAWGEELQGPRPGSWQIVAVCPDGPLNLKQSTCQCIHVWLLTYQIEVQQLNGRCKYEGNAPGGLASLPRMPVSLPHACMYFLASSQIEWKGKMKGGEAVPLRDVESFSALLS